MHMNPAIGMLLAVATIMNGQTPQYRSSRMAAPSDAAFERSVNSECRIEVQQASTVAAKAGLKTLAPSPGKQFIEMVLYYSAVQTVLASNFTYYAIENSIDLANNDMYSLMICSSVQLATPTEVKRVLGNWAHEEKFSNTRGIHSPMGRDIFDETTSLNKCAVVGERLARGGYASADLLAGYYSLGLARFDKAIVHYEAAYARGQTEAAAGYAFLLGLKGKPYRNEALADQIRRKAQSGEIRRPETPPFTIDSVYAEIASRGCKEGWFRQLVADIDRSQQPSASATVATNYSGEQAYKDLAFGMQREAVGATLNRSCASTTDGREALKDPMVAGIAQMTGQTAMAQNYLYGQKCYDKQYDITTSFDESLHLNKVHVEVGTYSPMALKELDEALQARFGGRVPPSEAEVNKFFDPSSTQRIVTGNQRNLNIRDESSYDRNFLYYMYANGKVRIRVGRYILDGNSKLSLAVTYLRSDLARLEADERNKKRFKPTDF